MDNKVKILLSVIIIVAFSVLFLNYLSIPSSDLSRPQRSGKMTVSASFYPLYFLASQIGGDKVEVFNITPAGTEPHDFEPSARDIVRIQDSRILIINGAGLESWADNIKRNINSENTAVIEAADGLATLSENQMADPHVWLSPKLAQNIADKIAVEFEMADPANASYYASNAANLKVRLNQLDSDYRNSLGDCQKKDFITSHAAFSYLADAYNIVQIPIAGLSPESEPSPRQLADISQIIKSEGIDYIFFESLVSPKLAQTMATETGAKTLVLNPIEGLTPSESAAGEDYFSIMRENLSNLKTALQCQ